METTKAKTLQELRLIKLVETNLEPLDKYDHIVQGQLKDGIILDKADKEQTGKFFYNPYKSAIEEAAESTKIGFFSMNLLK